MSARVSPVLESVELKSSSSVSAEAQLMLSNSTQTAGGNTTDPTESSEQEVSPTAAAMENSPTDKMKNKKGIHAFLLRTKRAVKHSALCWRRDNKVAPDPFGVEPVTQQDEVDLPAVEKQAKMKKKKGIVAFLRRTWKAIKPSANKIPIPDPCNNSVDLQPGLSGLESGVQLPVNVVPADPKPSPAQCPSSLEKTPVPDPSNVTLKPDMGQAGLEPSPVPGPSGCGSAVDEEEKGIWAHFRHAWRGMKLFALCFHSGNKVDPDPYTIEPVTHLDPADLQSGFSLPLTTDHSASAPELPSLFEPSDFEPAVGSLSSLYILNKRLGSGSFGIVYKATRRSDGQKVAVKFVQKSPRDYFIVLPECPKPLPAEVAVNLVLRKPPTSPHIVQMLDWFDEPERYILIMEYPHPCDTLLSFIIDKGGYLDESVARGLFRQAVLAAKHCVDRGVFDGDIKLDNILVNTKTLQLKFIDFGCSEIFREEANKKWLVSAAVRSLGMVLYGMLGRQENIEELSEWCNLMNQCKSSDRTRIPTLEQILQHEWFRKEEAPESGSVTLFKGRQIMGNNIRNHPHERPRAKFNNNRANL